MKLLQAVTGNDMYVESLVFRKEGEPKTMDMHLKNMVERRENAAEAEAVLKLMVKLSYTLEDALDFYDLEGLHRDAVKTLVEEKVHAQPA